MKTTALVFSSLVMLLMNSTGMATAGTFVQPNVSGTTPSGLDWSAVATGTALPIRTSATNPNNGAAGAVVYVDTQTGVIQFDPKGLSVSTFILTYTTGTVNPGANAPGPFDPNVPNPFPGGGSGTVTPSRVMITVGPPLGAALNIQPNPTGASTNGFWNLPWAFPPDLVASGSVSALAPNFVGTGSNYFRTIGQGSNLNANVLGYGSQQGVFQYTVNGITGNQVGAVIPVVPEPSTYAMALAGLACGGYSVFRRRRA